jgi:hypothetical protein
MPKNNDITGEEFFPGILGKALLLACQQIAANSQCYEEINTAEGWYELFIQKAESEITGPTAEIAPSTPFLA